uniref:Uncharacterized protein n=1 Tax=Pavo cristatus TaxID=9049 RepID=A0A8C9FGC5_PAVCR
RESPRGGSRSGGGFGMARMLHSEFVLSEKSASSSSPHPIALLFAFLFFPSPGCCLRAERCWKGEAAGEQGDAPGTVAVPARVGQHRLTKRLGTALVGSARSLRSTGTRRFGESEAGGSGEHTAAVI